LLTTKENVSLLTANVIEQHSRLQARGAAEHTQTRKRAPLPLLLQRHLLLLLPLPLL
jgi:hypothetical protein